MVSKKVRNKTRKRGGGGCGILGCLPNAKVSPVVEPTPINKKMNAAKQGIKNVKTQRAKNKANARAQQRAELAELRRQGKEKAKEYANSIEPLNGKTLSQEEWDLAYLRYISFYNERINHNILNNQPLISGLNSIIPKVSIEPNSG
jgi:hypothetical protein